MPPAQVKLRMIVGLRSTEVDRLVPQSGPGHVYERLDVSVRAVGKPSVSVCLVLDQTDSRGSYRPLDWFVADVHSEAEQHRMTRTKAVCRRGLASLVGIP
jgi:hypothetical protein